MDPYVIFSAVVMGVVLAAILCWKGRLPKKVVIGGIIIGIVSGLLVNVIIPQVQFIVLLLADFIVVIGLGLSILAIWFYRDPERIPPDTKRVILAPADGKVKYIKKIEKNTIPLSTKKNHTILLDEFTKTESFSSSGHIIGIVMSILDVHVNRAPVPGKIIFFRHFPGFFYSLKNPQALIENERATFIFDTGEIRVGIVLIASRLVRKIVPYKCAGDIITMGERIGMIKFGSQTDIIVPEEVTIIVKEGEQVFAGQTVIAKY